eukprot:CAMPEP_0114464050 /NCGR_PEP_ID=MMETSP0104-20121206/7699_1 /TAXON_ID=37642 ORGANISM="Paraphysomonas imperforata, Strain PA2" /NCGR_SAMPLE_ID=MMETSP0104 /ASSEMBLY_ACC=CAM_ASM_000202 /LENGTH=101 /DNA_ID=CAMNT_0001637057 /DNA_START=160 /DNA_END=461 /DNA_ORIENTATION=+
MAEDEDEVQLGSKRCFRDLDSHEEAPSSPPGLDHQLRKSSKKSSYACTRCGLPKRGHTCALMPVVEEEEGSRNTSIKKSGVWLAQEGACLRVCSSPEAQER